ncbi:MAG: cation diffusion facilitator family transporter [Ignavibacteriales bacterium]|nr:cation diffusion facilitator family transporter [Ignavibacteriales bacterium]
MKVTWVGAAVNVALSGVKIAAGVIANSTAMIADGAHSISDLATDAAVLLGFRYVKKPSDEGHNYGHGKFETAAGFFVGLSLVFVAVGVAAQSGWQLYRKFFFSEALDVPGGLALAAALVSIAVKEAIYRYQIVVGERHKSDAIVANAWHHRSDALSSIAAAVGVGGAMLFGEEWAILDPVSALFVAGLVGQTAYRILRRNTDELLEASLGKEAKRDIERIVSDVDGADRPHKIRTRKIGGYAAIEMHVEVDGAQSVEAAHEIVKDLERRLEKRFGADAIVTVHIDPR